MEAPLCVCVWVGVHVCLPQVSVSTEISSFHPMYQFLFEMVEAFLPRNILLKYPELYYYFYFEVV